MIPCSTTISRPVRTSDSPPGCLALAMPMNRSRDISDRLDVTVRLDQRVGTLSHGWKKRFSLARALLHDPPILLMDEPESGLDEQALTGLGEVIREESVLRRTVLLTTHNFERGLQFSDEVAILSKGRLVYREEAARVRDADALRDTYAQYVP